jgi:hypothetical protein
MSRLTNVALAASVSGLAAVALQAGPAHAATTTSSQAELAGRLGYEGGAFPDTFHPTAGSIEVEFDSVTPITLEHRVGSSGHFKIALPAGKFTVIGCGPSASGGTASGQCSQPVNFTLTAGEVHHVKLIWAMVP